MTRKRQRDYGRSVGKSGGTSRWGKVFGDLVKEWSTKKAYLTSLGYKVEVGDVRDYTQYYRIHFPDGHHYVDMALEEALRFTG